VEVGPWTKDRRQLGGGSAGNLPAGW
jgi:hypothetical protein